MEPEQSITGLYYRYKKTSDENLRDYLTRYKIIVEKKKGYFALNEESIAKISDRLRGISLNFDATETEKEPIEGLVEWKTVKFLVKSTSRFFVKADIGEIFDQIHWEDLFYKNTFKAILFDPTNHVTVPDTEGEHFVMSVKLFK